MTEQTNDLAAADTEIVSLIDLAAPGRLAGPDSAARARVAELGVLTRRPRDLWLWAQAEVGQMLGS